MANFVLGFISCIIFYAINIYATGNTLWEFLNMVLLYSIYMNVGFMIFNLIPIPPLDGSKIVMEFLPYNIKYKIYQYERYFGLILIIFVYAGVMTPVLGVLRDYVISFYEFCSMAIFGLFI